MFTTDHKGHVCSHRHSFALDNIFRKLLQNPGKIVGEYVSRDDTVFDIGCGPGFFSIDMARMVGPGGQVFAVDLQKEMLEKVRKKAEKLGLADRITLHQCSEHSIGLDDDIKADFILAYYMVHETPDQKQFLTQIKSLLKKNGRFLLVEPFFHVNRKKFQRMTRVAEKIGFQILDTPAKKGGRSLLLSV